MFEIKKSVFVKTIVHMRNRPKPELPEFAFVGRSNVGKSSLINSLTNRKNLAKVSKRPGKTQTINYFLINESFYFVDLPGYGFARVPVAEKEKWRLMVENYLVGNANLKNIWVLIDMLVGPKDSDGQLIDWLRANRLSFQIIGTKSDRLSHQRRLRRISEIRQILNLKLETEIIPFSTKQGFGKERFLQKTIEILNNQLGKNIDSNS